MGFHKLLKESLMKTNLVRVRVKTDPAKISDNEDFRKIAGYEGFILSEDRLGLKILLLDPELTIKGGVPSELLEILTHQHDIDLTNDYKNYAKGCLAKHKNKKENDPVFGQIDNTSDIGEIEVFLRQSGYTENELNDLYRSYIGNE
jgi:hypothetical protein